MIFRTTATLQLFCFTFDLEDVCDDLMSAAKRGVSFSAHSDKQTTLNQNTRDQLQRLRALQANGYSRVGRSVPPGNGILHMKDLQVDNLATVAVQTTLPAREATSRCQS
jgi:hypothetical protein